VRTRTRKAYRFRIYPNEEQRRILERTLQTCRILYNKLLAERRETYKKTGQSPSYYEQKRSLTKRRDNDPYLPQVHSQVLQDVALRLERAFERFFKRDKNGRKAGYPRFKGRNRYDSFTYPQYGNGAILKDGRLQLSKIGEVRIFQHRPIPPNATVKTCTIRRDVDKWYACFTVETAETTTLPRYPRTKVGIDFGLNSLITLSNGEKVRPPKFLRKSERKLKRELRRLSRKKRNSQNRRKQVIKVARIQRKTRLQRTDFNHKLSRILVNRFDMISFENLQIPNMMKNHKLAKAIADAAWGQLRLFTSYKAEEAGKIVELVDPYGTTVDCSRCGFHVPKTFSERIHKCPNCGLMLDRDWNAAVNILNRVGGGTAEFTPVETQPLLGPCVVAEQAGSKNQEAHDL
jgi:putative transposase